MKREYRFGAHPYQVGLPLNEQLKINRKGHNGETNNSVAVFYAAAPDEEGVPLRCASLPSWTPVPPHLRFVKHLLNLMYLVYLVYLGLFLQLRDGIFLFSEGYENPQVAICSLQNPLVRQMLRRTTECVFLSSFGSPVANEISFATGHTTHLVYLGFHLCRLFLKHRAVFFCYREATKTRKLQFDLYESLLSYPCSTASVEISETFIKSHLLPMKVRIWYIWVSPCVAYF